MNVKEMAEKTETKTIFCEMTKGELEETKDDLIDCNVKIAQLTAERRKMLAGINEQIKHAQKLLGEKMQIILAKGENVEIFCYLIPDQDAGVMKYYDIDGRVVYTRPLRQAERQLSLKLADTGA